MVRDARDRRPPALPRSKAGRTRKREPPIDRFQAGEVPVFLISL